MPTTMPFYTLKLSVCIVAVSLLSMSCGPEADAVQSADEITSYLEGRISLSTEVDTVADYSGFRVLVADQRANRIDTLAFAETDTSGYFAVEVVAPREDIYSLVLARNNAVLRVDDIVIAQDDSASFQVTFPFGNRPILIRSEENAALLGYKNTMALYNRDVRQLTGQEETTRDEIGMLVSQTTELLWNLREANPGSVVSRLAAVQSIRLLEGWNDSLLVARTRMLDPDSPELISVLETARQAQVRVGGTGSAVELIESLKAGGATPNHLAVLQSELVLALRDDDRRDEALEAARLLKLEYATDSTWITWADRAMYDLENLAPGMDAPGFEQLDVEGRPLNLDQFAGKYLILEFYAPGPSYEQDLPPRNAAYRASGDPPAFEILSFSLQRDTLLHEAFFDGRDIPGRHVILPDGGDAAILDTYNVQLIPTRFLIDPEGKIVRKYVLDNGIAAFREARDRSNR